MKPDYELAQRVADYLNELLKIDPAAIEALFEVKVPCRKEIKLGLPIRETESGDYLTLLGLLNGLCGITENELTGILSGWREDPARAGRRSNDCLTGFRVYRLSSCRTAAENPPEDPRIDEDGLTGDPDLMWDVLGHRLGKELPEGGEAVVLLPVSCSFNDADKIQELCDRRPRLGPDYDYSGVRYRQVTFDVRRAASSAFVERVAVLGGKVEVGDYDPTRVETK